MLQHNRLRNALESVSAKTQGQSMSTSIINKTQSKLWKKIDSLSKSP